MGTYLICDNEETSAPGNFDPENIVWRCGWEGDVEVDYAYGEYDCPLCGNSISYDFN